MLWKLSNEQNHRCCYCGRKTLFSCEMTEKDNQYIMATLDHIKTKATGGTRAYKNAVMSCRRCNELRGQVDAYRFAQVVQKPNRFLDFFLKENNRVKFLLRRYRKAIKNTNDSIYNILDNNDINFIRKYGDLLGIEI